jgi:TolB protein
MGNYFTGKRFQLGLVLLLLVNGLLLFAWFILRPSLIDSNTSTNQPQIAGNSTAMPENQLNSTITQEPIQQIPSNVDGLTKDGLIILAIQNGSASHLYGYHPLHQPLTRMHPNVTFDEMAPAVNSGSTRLAYTSRSNGYWDIFVEDTTIGQSQRVTDSLPFDTSPSFSPDAQWLTYTSYLDGDLDILLLSLTDSGASPIPLTNERSADYSPAWSPAGRIIAFVSDRSGQPDVWLADLDQVDNRFQNISSSTETIESSPAWSPDGRYLAWAGMKNGFSYIYLWDSQNQSQPARQFAPGTLPAWNPSGNQLLAVITAPNTNGIVAYDVSTSQIALPYTPLPGTVTGAAWLSDTATAYLDTISTNPVFTSSPGWAPILTLPAGPAGRRGMVPLANVNAPYPYLHDAVDESFIALSNIVGHATGWDFLANLENAYLPLTEPPTPGSPENWLYTGRAIAINAIPLQTGWMTVTREDFQGETYWRIFLKARHQDGSQGKPLTSPVWDINARYSGDPAAYEAGGAWKSAPSGYWIDFTEIALAYGWERLPALPTWQTFFPAARINQFVLTNQLDWQQAMLEVYSPEALSTPTPLPTRTLTSSPTPKPNITIAPTRTPAPSATPTYTPTPQPTWTPAP